MQVQVQVRVQEQVQVRVQEQVQVQEQEQVEHLERRRQRASMADTASPPRSPPSLAEVRASTVRSSVPRAATST